MTDIKHLIETRNEMDQNIADDLDKTLLRLMDMRIIYLKNNDPRKLIDLYRHGKLEIDVDGLAKHLELLGEEQLFADVIKIISHPQLLINKIYSFDFLSRILKCSTHNFIQLSKNIVNFIEIRLGELEISSKNSLKIKT